MNRIKFNSETKVFGIQSDRVRKGILDWYKSNNLEDTEEYKDLLERKELLDEIERSPKGIKFLEDAKYLPYGYAATPNHKSDQIIRTVPWAPQGYFRSISNYDKVNRDVVNKRDIELARNELTDVYALNLYLNANKNNEKLNYFDSLYQDTDTKLTPKLKDKMIKEGIKVTEGDGDTLYKRESGEDKININPNSKDSSAFHEYQHYKNSKSGINDSHDSAVSRVKMTDSDEIKKTYRDPERIHDYINKVLIEEQSANRGAVMNPYLYGGDEIYLDTAYHNGLINQGTYESFAGNKPPVPLRYEMDNESLKRLKSNKAKLGIK